MSITIDIPPDLEILLKQAARQQGKDVADVLLDCAIGSLPPHILMELENKLLLALNTPLLPAVRQERDALLEMQRQRPLTDEEMARFGEVSDQIEMHDAERVRYIGELSRLRGVSFTEMARQFGFPAW